MTISDKVRGRVAEEVSSEDIRHLLNEIENGGAESFKPARILLKAADKHPALVAEHHERLASVLNTPLPPVVRRQLYRVALETDITSGKHLRTILNSVEADLIEGEATTRAYVYRLLELAGQAGVEPEDSCIEALLTGIGASPGDTPAAEAMDAYLSAIKQKNTIGDRELAPLLDLMDSDFPELSSAAFDVLIQLINSCTISPEANTEGVKMAIDNYGAHSVSSDRINNALQKLS